MEEAERSFVNEADESVLIDYQRSGDAEGDDFMSVDELQNCGIGAIDIQKLKLAGICTIKVSQDVCLNKIEFFIVSREFI